MLFAALLGFAVACGGNEKKEEPKKDEAKAKVEAQAEVAPEAAPEVTEESAPTAPEAQQEEARKPIELTVSEFDKDLNLTVKEDINISVAEAQVADDTRAKKETKLQVGTPKKEVNKGANLKVGAELTTATLEVAK